MKPLQMIISGFLGLWGTYLVIYFWGDLRLTGIVSIIIGMGLIGMGVISIVMFLRGRLKNHMKY